MDQNQTDHMRSLVDRCKPQVAESVAAVCGALNLAALKLDEQRVEIEQLRAVNKLEKLIRLCKCGISLTINEHRDYYITAAQKLLDLEQVESALEIEPDVRAKMIERDTIVVLQFYPDTPIGFFRILHYDFNAALDEGLNCLRAAGKL